MTLAEMLDSLSQAWDVSLTSHEVGPSSVAWSLEIRRWDDGGDLLCHSYRGTLASVVARAYGGERGD